MHCYGMSQSITDRFAAVVEVFFLYPWKVLHSHVVVFFLKWVSLWFVEEELEEDDGTGQDKLLDK